MKQVIFLIFTILTIAFQNFTYVDWSSVKLTPINESLRSKHGKELLGSEFKSSDSRKKISKKEIKLHQKLHHLLKENLQEQDIESSLKISRSLIQESQKHKLDPFFVMAVIQTESRFNPRALGGQGEIGLMQIKPDTAQWIVEKFKLDVPDNFDLTDPAINIRIGTAYLSYLRGSFPKLPIKYIAAYNMGPQKVRDLTSKKKTPKEYPTKVLDNYKQINQLVGNRS